MLLPLFMLLISVASYHALYDANDDVIELTSANFNNMVVNTDEVWMVEFYAPWCGHCKSLASDWKKAAKALKGVVKVGAVDMDQHQTVGAPYNVRGFPTIKIFGTKKDSPQDYQGQREAKGIVDAALEESKKMVHARLGGHHQGGQGGSSSGSSSGDVVEVTDDNFQETVLQFEGIVLMGFFAPWCGHCQRLKPEWEKAAAELKGKAKIVSLDATVHQQTASKFQVQGYPTIKFFAAGAKTESSAEDYGGGRTSSDIVAFVLSKFVEDIDPPEIVELTGNDTLAECLDKSLCVVSVLQDILDTQAEGRNQVIDILKKVGELFKAKKWGWVWTAANVHPKLEESLSLGGSGFPALAAINIKKKVFVKHIGGFDEDGIKSTLSSLSSSVLRPNNLPALPELGSVPAWDGKDAEMPADDYDDEEDDGGKDDGGKDEL